MMSNKATPCAEITMPLTFDCNMLGDFCVKGNLFVDETLYVEDKCYCGGDEANNGGE